MKINLLCVVSLIISMQFYGQTQTVIGKWKTIDDGTSKASSIVEIYENSGKVYAKIVEILEKENEKKNCEYCTGSDKNKPLMGLVIIKGLSKDGAEFSGGDILDPNNGKLYKCLISLEGKDKLKVRGYIGFALMGRTQYWYRVKN